MLDRLLLVLMLDEILHTVRILILSKEFMVVKPLLTIGLIASIRRVLVITSLVSQRSQDYLLRLLLLSCRVTRGPGKYSTPPDSVLVG
jgi:phosphate-starvation-inducible protein E